MPDFIVSFLASKYAKYVVFALILVSHATALSTLLAADGHVQAATIVAWVVAGAGHLAQLLTASSSPIVTVAAAPAAQVKVAEKLAAKAAS